MDEPPDDPDAWSHEQWMAWLNATDPGSTDIGRAYAPRLSSRGGVVLGAAMLGLESVIYGEVKRPEIVVEIEASGQDDGLKIDLDPDDPSASTVIVPGTGR